MQKQLSIKHQAWHIFVLPFSSTFEILSCLHVVISSSEFLRSLDLGHALSFIIYY